MQPEPADGPPIRASGFHVELTSSDACLPRSGSAIEDRANRRVLTYCSRARHFVMSQADCRKSERATIGRDLKACDENWLLQTHTPR